MQDKLGNLILVFNQQLSEFRFRVGQSKLSSQSFKSRIIAFIEIIKFNSRFN
jgi:hypothetical protein